MHTSETQFQCVAKGIATLRKLKFSSQYLSILYVKIWVQNLTPLRAF